MNPRRRTTASLVSVAVLVAALAASARPALAAFPGANGKIVFTSDRDGNDEIYVMNADGTAQTTLTNTPASDARPAWSPDGSKIVFTSNRDGNAEIYVMNADGSAQTNLTNNPATDTEAAWSPDGSKIVFDSSADGTAQTNLTNNSATDDAAVWSPDGSRIAFASTRGGFFFDIWVMNSDGSGAPVDLTNTPAGSDVRPDWSPDGTKWSLPEVRRGFDHAACGMVGAVVCCWCRSILASRSSRSAGVNFHWKGRAVAL